jgi:archaellum component FlaC
MDLDQLQKRLQWIEDERRKERDAIGGLENRLLSYDGGIVALNQQIKDISGEVTRLSAIINRMDQYDQNMLQIRLETKRLVEELAKDYKQRIDKPKK